MLRLSSGTASRRSGKDSQRSSRIPAASLTYFQRTSSCAKVLQPCHTCMQHGGTSAAHLLEATFNRRCHFVRLRELFPIVAEGFADLGEVDIARQFSFE